MDELRVGELYSNEEIYRSLSVSNAGGIRLKIRDGVVLRAAIFTSLDPSFHAVLEKPYRDRLEGDILTYTAAGKTGEQTLAGMNQRLVDQRSSNFPIHGFAQIAGRRDKAVGPKRWRYLGLLQCLRHYQDTQLDSDGKVRKVWIFELCVHSEPREVPLALDATLSNEVLMSAGDRPADRSDDEVVDSGDQCHADRVRIEVVRARLLALEPRKFEYFIRDLLVHTGFVDVCVTKYSADGGVDVNARAGAGMWVFEHTLVQVQAKRWLHSVGRKEVAELRGSLQPFARGTVVTTSHFSKAAIEEAKEEGKGPIALIDGYRLSKVVLEQRFEIAV